MNKVRLNKLLSKRKGDRTMDRLEILPNNHKYVKFKKQKTKVFEKKFFAFIATYIKKQLHINHLFVYLFL